MTGLFVAILNMSITASYIAAAIIVVRVLLKKMPKVYSYVLWFAVLIRLVCPISFNSSLSLLSLLKPNVQASSGAPAYIAYNTGSVPNSGPDVGINTINNFVNPSLPATIPAASGNPAHFFPEMASMIWIGGMVLLLIYSIISYLKVRENVKTATLIKDKLFETDRITTAFIFGLVKPKIYVPVGLSSQDLSYILAHEKVHMNRLDYLIKPFAFLALIVHWFNPLMWVSFSLMSKDMEMSCDEGVIKRMGYEVKSSYSNSLLSFAMKRNRLLPGSPLAFGESNIKARINNVLKYKKPALWLLVLTIIALAALLVAFMANPNNERTFAPTTYSGYAVGILADNKTAYVGNNSKVAALIDAIPLPSGFARSTIELQTDASPYGITVNCSINDIAGVKDQNIINNIFYRNCIMLFSLIDNVDVISYNVTDQANPGGVFSFTCSRDAAEKLMGQDVRQYGGGVDALENLIDRLDAMSFEPNAGARRITSLSAVRSKMPFPIFIPTVVPAGLIPELANVDENSPALVRVDYHTEDGNTGLTVLNGPAGSGLAADPRKKGETIRLRDDIEGHFLNNQPQFGGPILWWEEAGSYIALSGPELSKTDLVNMAVSMSPTAGIE